MEVAKEQERDLSNDRFSWESNTIHPLRDKFPSALGSFGLLMLFVAVGCALFNLYVHFAGPALRRSSAPARTRNMEQEFLQLKLLHENGVISNEDFEKKKHQLRARVMLE